MRLLLTCTFVLGLPIAASPAAADQDVYPTGVYPDDVLHVAAAAAAGGTVHLRATNAAGVPTAFEFDGIGRVYATVDVAFVGETVGDARTTIRGGNAPLYSLPGPRFEARGIRFEHPRFAAIQLRDSVGAVIADNEIVSVIGTHISPLVTKGQGVWISFGTGDLLVEGNVITDVNANVGYGVVAFMTAPESALLIRNNSVSDVDVAGVALYGNGGLVAIEDNVLEPGLPHYPNGSIGNGLLIGGNPGPVEIARNSITCVNPEADGIAMYLTPAAVIVDNVIEMSSSEWGGITLLEDTDGAYVGQNTIRGDAAWALGVSWSFVWEVTSGVLISGNNVALLSPSVATVFMDANAQDNVLEGLSRDVLDLGTGNRITGHTRMNGGDPLGQTVREARALLHDAAAADAWLEPVEGI